MGLISQPKLNLIFIDFRKKQTCDFSPSGSETGIPIRYVEAMYYQIAYNPMYKKINTQADGLEFNAPKALQCLNKNLEISGATLTVVCQIQNLKLKAYATSSGL